MESRLVFLIVCGVFSGFCFVVGCTASIIKAVRDRKRILKNRSDRIHREGTKDTELMCKETESPKKSLTGSDANDGECLRKESVRSDRHRKSGVSSSVHNKKDGDEEAANELIETSFHSPSKKKLNCVPISVLEQCYGAHAQSPDLVLDDETLTEQERAKEYLKTDPGGSNGCRQRRGEQEGEQGVEESKDREVIRQDKRLAHHGSHGTFIVDSEPPVARTKSYQAAMGMKINSEMDSLPRSDIDWSSRENILKIPC